MFDERDRAIIAVLREGARTRLTTISERTGIPVSTVHERVDKLMRSSVRMASILDFRRIRVPLVCWAFVRTGDRDGMRELLMREPFVNTLLETNNGADFVCECVFPGFLEQHELDTAITALGRVAFYPMIDTVGREMLTP